VRLYVTGWTKLEKRILYLYVIHHRQNFIVLCRTQLSLTLKQLTKFSVRMKYLSWGQGIWRPFRLREQIFINYNLPQT